MIQLVSTEGSSVSDSKSQGAAERIQDVDSVNGGDGEKSDKSNKSADNIQANSSR